MRTTVSLVELLKTCFVVKLFLIFILCLLKHKNWGWKSPIQKARCASWLQLIIFSRLDILHDMIQIKQSYCQFGQLRFLSKSNPWPNVSLHQNDSNEFHLVMYTALLVSCVLPSLFVWLIFFVGTLDQQSWVLIYVDICVLLRLRNNRHNKTVFAAITCGIVL